MIMKNHVVQGLPFMGPFRQIYRFEIISFGNKRRKRITELRTTMGLETVIRQEVVTILITVSIRYDLVLARINMVQTT